jgi:predicted  nucleic acid-binding Zn-ribbon protein
MPLFPIKTCAVCGEEFELKPNKPGFANRCPDCTEEEQAAADAKLDADQRREKSELDAARRETIRNMLYRKES